VAAIVFMPDSLSIIAGSHEGAVSMWNFKKEVQPCRLYLHKEMVSIAITAQTNDGDIIVLGSHDGTVKVWKSTLKEPQVIDHKVSVSSAVFSPDYENIVSRSTDGRIIISDVGSGALKHWIKGKDWSENAAIAFSPGGGFVVLGLLNGEQATVNIYSVETGKCVFSKVEEGMTSDPHYPNPRLFYTP
jgi:WD40 repeat protein